jgi:hypothetical protein
MLLASVPQLHTKWEEIEAALEAPEPVISAGADGALGDDGESSRLVEVEHEHFVATG